MRNVMAVLSSTTCCHCVVFASFVTHVEHGPHRPSSCTYPHPMVSITQFAQHTYNKHPRTCQLHMSTDVAVTLTRYPKKVPQSAPHRPKARARPRPLPRARPRLLPRTRLWPPKGKAQTLQGKAHSPQRHANHTRPGPSQGQGQSPDSQLWV